MADVRSFDEIIDDLLSKEEKWSQARSVCYDDFSTGFPSIDNVTGGWHPGDFVVVGAQTGHGKSAIGNQMCFSAARQLMVKTKQTGIFAGKVLLFSPEMRDEQIFMRQSALMARVASMDLKFGSADDEERDRWRKKLQQLKVLEPYLTIVSGSHVYIEDILTHVRSEQGIDEDGSEYNNVKLLAVDYTQRLLSRQGGRNNTTETVRYVCQQLKEIANRWGITILALAQLNRDYDKDRDENNEKRKPRMSDLQHSSALEQEADIGLLIYRPDSDGPVSASETDIVEILVAKHRNGPPGEVELYYNGPYTQFEDPLWESMKKKRKRARRRDESEEETGE